MTDFVEFPKMARLSRDVIVTEKIDGTNAQIFITEDGQIRAGSRTRWITPADDNFGFAAWVEEHRDELLTLGPGRHFGEWWGRGIQRGYGIPDRRLSLFNTQRWCLYGKEPMLIRTDDPRCWKTQEVLPPCVGLVPVIGIGKFDEVDFNGALRQLAAAGSFAAPGFMDPEGIVVFHPAGNVGFKKTLKRDGEPKSLKEAA